MRFIRDTLSHYYSYVRRFYIGAKRFRISLNRLNTKEVPQYTTSKTNKVEVLLSGGYKETAQVGGWLRRLDINKKFWPRFIPRGYYHKVGKSKPNTWTIMIQWF